MKKVLFATTAIVAFAGTASAEVALSGSAEMGIFDQDGGAGMEFFTDIDATFTMSGASDAGMAFGASVDLDESDSSNDGSGDETGAFDPSDDGGATIFISGDFGTVTMGDTDGALDWALTDAGDVGNGGSIADDETIHAGYNGDYLDGAFDGQILRYDNTFGALGFAVSSEGDGDGFAAGVKYALGNINIGVGFQDQDGPSAYGLSVDTSLGGGLSVGVEYSDWSDVNVGTVAVPVIGDADHLGIGVGFESGALTLHANYGAYGGDLDVDGIGVSAAYDLGGGASAHFGYGDSDAATTMSAGLAMSF